MTKMTFDIVTMARIKNGSEKKMKDVVEISEWVFISCDLHGLIVCSFWGIISEFIWSSIWDTYMKKIALSDFSSQELVSVAAASFIIDQRHHCWWKLHAVFVDGLVKLACLGGPSLIPD